jgi:hypothetical protein
MSATALVLIGEILGLLHRAQDARPSRPAVDPVPTDAPSDVQQATVH